MPNEFEEKPKGVLISMEEESFSGYLYNIWFPYTREFVKKVKEGCFVAIKNFTSNSSEQKFSILEVISALPQHYALGVSASDAEKAFPGFFVEAAKSARQDWEQDEPVEQTTVIKAQSISTGLQVSFRDGRHSKPENDESTPMVGEEAHLLSESFINEIVNQGLIGGSVPTIKPGNLVLNPNVVIHISTEDLLRLHFGIFGFTGAGKSNLMSTIIHSLLGQNNSVVKILLMDLMSEYTSLLIDALDKYEDSYIVVFGEDSLPGGEPTRLYLRGDNSKEDDAVDSIIRTILLPKELAPHRDKYAEKFRSLLRNKKIRVYDEGDTLTYSRVRAEVQSKLTGPLAITKRPLESWIEANLTGESNELLTPQIIEPLITQLNGFLYSGSIPESFLSDTPEQQTGTLQSFGMDNPVPRQRRVSQRTVNLNQTARNVIANIITTLRSFSSNQSAEIPEDMLITFDEILNISNSKDKPSLMIFQCNRDDELRERSSFIVNALFDIRRRIGLTDPTILSIYDEADEFMPGKVQADSSYAYSLGCIRNLARRGRKFGMGLAIATQRVAYLDTSTLAQPHTYFISKMPRKYDRDTMAEAFGVTEEMMKKTLKFTKGQWLLISYDATGLVNVPIPIQFPNTNKRIIEYISS